ncbi:unnamed protein product, partial [Oppiella nova]
MLDIPDKTPESDGWVTIETDSIYKDLRVMGYDYGSKFRKLKNIKTRDFDTMHGQVEWDGNWVTFIDSLLQSMAIMVPFRKLIVPVMIKSLKCDPRVLFDALERNKVAELETEFNEEAMLDEVVERDGPEESEEFQQEMKEKSQELMDKYLSQRFHLYKSIIPFHVNMSSKMAVTYGVEVEDVFTLPLTRKSNVQDLKLESYQFAANEDTMAMDERDRLYVMDYIKVCSTLALKLKHILGLNDIKSEPNPANNTNHTNELIEKYVKNIKEDEVMLKIYHELIQSSSDENKNLDKELAQKSLNKLRDDLSGKTPPYDISADLTNHVSKNEHLIRAMVDIVSENNVPKKEIKVLEINTDGGGGLMAAEVDSYLASAALYPIDVTYNIAVKSMDAIPDQFRNKTFKLLEWNPKESAFPSDISPKDLIITKDSVDLWALDLENHLQECHDVLMERGFLMTVFRTHTTPPELMLRELLGQKSAKSSAELEKRVAEYVAEANKMGFNSVDLWALDLENHLQECHDVLMERGFLMTVFRTHTTPPELMLRELLGQKSAKSSAELEKRVAEYVAEANKMGFSLIGRRHDSIGAMALLFRKVVSEVVVPAKKQIIEIDANYEQWFEALKQRMIDSKDDDNREPIWLIASNTGTDRSSISGIVGLVNCLRLEPGGDAIRCLFASDDSVKMPLNFGEKPFSQLLANDLAVNVVRDGRLGTYRHLTLHREYDRVPSSDYFLNVTANKDLSSLQWFDAKHLSPPVGPTHDLSNNPINHIKCDVYAAGLNFRDVMFATGRIAAGPQSLFMDCLIGFEFAGRRQDNGQRVCGFNMSQCFATGVTVNDRLASPVPENWTMEEAITVLSTYSTVWYGLIKRANLIKGERILIHSGAGGVGQAAISVCQYYGCEIYVTVGTDDKRQFLQKEFGIPADHIFSSRDIQFKYAIKQATKGKGVNLVLNSLTGDKLDASYDIIADCGRFVEIGKYDLQLNKQLGMFSFLRDVAFIGVSVDIKMYLENGFTDDFFKWMHANAANGCIRPINRTVFAANEAEKAFRYMTTGKHIGKILLRIRPEEQPRQQTLKGNGSVAPALALTTIAKTYFHPNKVYIITGGLGGFGIELAHWMITLGARKIVLTSRVGAKSDYQKFVIKRLQCFGERLRMFDAKVHVSTADCSTSAGARQLLSEAQTLGPVGGVFHLALVLNDQLLENQTYDKFAETIDSKVRCFQNLDQTTRSLAMDLDYFVCFSSVSCGKGNSGQSNYGYGNSVCERICEQRQRDGLSGQAIQWGPIDDVGVIADSDKFSTFSGVVKQRINSCLDILDKLLQTKHPIVSCVVRAKRQLASGTRESRIVAQIWMALGIDPNTTPDHLTLGEIGMESVFAVEFQQGLERDYDIKLTLNDIKNITIRNMKDFEAGNVEVFRQLARDIREARDKLSKIKFIIPSDTYTRLNSGKTGKPVYFLPPLEGIFASLEALAEKMDRPVIGLNWTADMEGVTDMKSITDYYLNLLKTLQPSGGYDIVGHFYGALLAVKMLRRKNTSVNKTVIIDLMSETQMTDEMLSDEYLVELITKFISKDLPQVVKDKLLRDM